MSAHLVCINWNTDQEWFTNSSWHRRVQMRKFLKSGHTSRNGYKRVNYCSERTVVKLGTNGYISEK